MISLGRGYPQLGEPKRAKSSNGTFHSRVDKDRCDHVDSSRLRTSACSLARLICVRKGTLMNATLVGLFVLGLASLSLNGNPGVPSENVDCGSDSSNTFTYGNNCYTTGGYCTGSDACRAAQQGLKDQMVAPTGVACNNQDCVPGTCHTAVRCLDATCSLLQYGPPIQNMETGKWRCTACWLGGDYKVTCTACETP